MQALQLYLPKPISQIVGRLARFKQCQISGLHIDCTCKQCCGSDCLMSTKRPYKRGIVIMRLYGSGAHAHYEDHRVISKEWACSAECLINSGHLLYSIILVNHIDGAGHICYITGKLGSTYIFTSDSLVDELLAYLMNRCGHQRSTRITRADYGTVSETMYRSYKQVPWNKICTIPVVGCVLW